MDTDRNDELGSPMIEDFLDCDQLVSDSDTDNSSSASPRRSLKRLHIHIDMSPGHYLAPGGAHHSQQPSASLELPMTTSGPQTGTYSSVADLAPFSAVSGVSSFNYPAAADPSLLTPASSSGSPPLGHKSKPMRTYNTPGLGSNQAPTPPDTSKLYGYGGYDLHSAAQSPSPMTVNPAVTEASAFDVTPYMAHSPSSSHHHPSSPRDNIPPPPINPYLGHFTVSGPHDGDLPNGHPLHEYHGYPVEVAQPGAYLSQPPQPQPQPLHQQQPQQQQNHVPVNTAHMHHRMPSTEAPHFRSGQALQVGAIEDLRDPSMFLGPYPPGPGSHSSLGSPGRKPASQRKKPSPSRKPPRTPRTTSQVGGGSDAASAALQPDDNGEELTLRDDAPEDDKFLFQLRKEFLSEKGKGMWEEMKAKYTEKHAGNWEKAALQMKVSRAVARYGVWPQKEIERLKEAYAYVESMRYQIILARMKENGGCRCWDWKPQHIEAMLVKLGYEEPVKDEKTGSRRRRQQKAAARRQGSPQQQHPAPPQQPLVMGTPAAPTGDWTGATGLGLHPGYPNHAHAQYIAAAARQGHHPYHPQQQPQHQQHFVNGAAGLAVPEEFAVPPSLTAKQEEDLVSDIFKDSRCLTPEEDEEEGMQGVAYENGAAPAGAGGQVAQLQGRS
ncbi:hypothetical protein VTJ49DRAFT_1521 [Mycothermus thermophilus]|uniref:Myb-like domain-containing protein n=1 Tax=Humicola insolens TaxID=85995 RepID=A0ABR3VC83_HUMIN